MKRKNKSVREYYGWIGNTGPYVVSLEKATPIRTRATRRQPSGPTPRRAYLETGREVSFPLGGSRSR